MLQPIFSMFRCCICNIFAISLLFVTPGKISWFLIKMQAKCSKFTSSDFVTFSIATLQQYIHITHHGRCGEFLQWQVTTDHKSRHI